MQRNPNLLTLLRYTLVCCSSTFMCAATVPTLLCRASNQGMSVVST
uniref:Uncharacterized protein n=1 Tax=Aegilops tauschii subsp. strangulata TaxID=200361 RepID=A0A453K2Y3_AEGTS